MNCIKLKNMWFQIPGNGIQVDETNLKIDIIANGSSVEEVQGLLDPIPDPIVIYADDFLTKTGEFSGYTVLKSLMKEFNREIIELNRKEDVIVMCFACPDLEDRVDANEAQTFYTAMMTDTLLEEE